MGWGGGGQGEGCETLGVEYRWVSKQTKLLVRGVGTDGPLGARKIEMLVHAHVEKIMKGDTVLVPEQQKGPGPFVYVKTCLGPVVGTKMAAMSSPHGGKMIAST